MLAIDLLIFDLDGTLVDTRRDLAESANYARNRLGFPDLEVEQIMQFVGDGLRKLMQRSLPGATDTHIDTAINVGICAPTGWTAVSACRGR